MNALSSSDTDDFVGEIASIIDNDIVRTGGTCGIDLGGLGDASDDCPPSQLDNPGE
jgi:hypothetical protein